MKESTLTQITERLVRILDSGQVLQKSGHLEVWDRGGTGFEYRAQEHPGFAYAVWYLSNEDKAHRAYREINGIRFTPEPGWLCLIGQQREYDRFVLWRYKRPGRTLTVEMPEEEFLWEVRPECGNRSFRIICEWKQRPKLAVAWNRFDLEYTPKDDGLILTRVSASDNRHRVEPAMLPEIKEWMPSLATSDGRERYLRVRRESAGRYLAECAAWAEHFNNMPASLRLDGDAYIYEGARIPVKLFDLDVLLARLIEQLDAFLVRVPPANKYVAPAAR